MAALDVRGVQTGRRIVHQTRHSGTTSRCSPIRVWSSSGQSAHGVPTFAELCLRINGVQGSRDQVAEAGSILQDVINRGAGIGKGANCVAQHRDQWKKWIPASVAVVTMIHRVKA